MNKELDTKIQYIASLSDNKVQFDTNGLKVIAALDYWEWETLGKGLKKLDDCLQWWIGDWLNYGEQRYGEMYSQAMEIFGLEYSTMRDYKSVSANIEKSLRNDNLKWSHHKAVAYLEPDEQVKFLNEAEAEGLSVARLRGRIKNYKKQGDKPCEHIWITKCSVCGETE